MGFCGRKGWGWEKPLMLFTVLGSSEGTALEGLGATVGAKG